MQSPRQRARAHLVSNRWAALLHLRAIAGDRYPPISRLLNDWHGDARTRGRVFRRGVCERVGPWSRRTAYPPSSPSYWSAFWLVLSWVRLMRGDQAAHEHQSRSYLHSLAIIRTGPRPTFARRG